MKLVHSLYGKISAVYLLLLLALGVILTALTVRSYSQFTAEADQKLNRTLADSLAVEFSPFFGDTLDMAGIEHTMHYLMVMNPRLEIYLLSEQGEVLAFFADPAKVRQNHVGLEPIHRFLEGSAAEVILGDDPRQPGQVKPFTVAPLQINSETQGYLYAILGGEEYDSALGMVRDSAILRVTFTGVLIILGFTGLVGLVLFFFLTRRFRTMTDAVRRFERGDLARRVPVHRRDEIGQLGQAFNRMADTIEATMKELQRTDDLRRELIANVSHDLRSPLASIQGYIETILIKNETLTPEERQRYLEIILDNTTMLNTLVNELFELSKLDAREVEPRPEPFSLAELAQDVVMKFQPQAEQRRVHLDASLSPTLPMVRADIGMIERVLSNLLDNALRYTPSEGRVHVDLHRANGAIHVTVSDTGEGIPDDDLPYIHERFYRVDKSRAHGSGGSGLGLAIAHKILDLHGSRLHIESAVGRGTTVSFDLHIADGGGRGERGKG